MVKYCLANGYWEHDPNDTIDSVGKTDYIKYCLSDSAKQFQDYNVIQMGLKFYKLLPIFLELYFN